MRKMKLFYAAILDLLRLPGDACRAIGKGIKFYPVPARRRSRQLVNLAIVTGILGSLIILFGLIRAWNL